MNTQDPAFEARRLRDCLGQFATGVTVVTVKAADGSLVGLTANSFSSVSLDPPLVLWSLQKEAASLPVFKDASYYAINVLGADQMDISNHFARPAEDKFEGVDYSLGASGAPLIDGCVAWFECRNEITHEGGDHLIFVGHVERFDHAERPALLFVAGRYGVPARHPQVEVKAPPIPQAKGEKERVMGDRLVSLLTRAGENVVGPFHGELEAIGISPATTRTLARIAGEDGKDIDQVARSIFAEPGEALANARQMELDGLVELREEGGQQNIYLTGLGGEKIDELMGRADRYEAEITAGYGDDEVDVLKSVLRTLIYRATEDG
ncbi:MAG: flavin reductase [Rhodospirillales bacterium]|jgi:3-hydroxy-9,10-secoandrosta-1,3,5(10)-triene-9,17-dione monooxygenase reductase component|nr:flavin reductase [Rhodospirillales bacterium]